MHEGHAELRLAGTRPSGALSFSRNARVAARRHSDEDDFLAGVDGQRRGGGGARGTQNEVTLGWHVDPEWNASLAAFGGIGFDVGVKLPLERQLRLTAGAFALQLPSFGLGQQNQGQGWTAVDRAALLGAQYYFSPSRGGFYVGLDALYQQRTLSKAGQSDTAVLGQYIVAGVVGFEWFPFSRLGLYVEPNFTFAVRLGESGTPQIGGATFVESPFLPLPGMSIGWES